MDGYKIPILLLTTVLLGTTATGLAVEINLESLADHSTKDIQTPENFTDTLQINASVMNPGSVACQYQLRTDNNQTQNNQITNTYSEKQTILPGQTERLNLYQTPLNYTGEIQGNLTIEYCGLTEQVENYTTQKINQTNLNTTANNSVLEPREKTVNKTTTQLETPSELENTTLVPHETPGYWKVQPAKVENQTAKLKYEAPVFEQWRNITYIAIDQETQEPQTLVKTDLNQEQLLREKITSKKYQLLLAISIILNIAAIIYINKEKARSKVLNKLNKL